MLISVIIAFLLIIWYVFLYVPVCNRMKMADTSDLEMEIVLEQMRAAGIRSMKWEIEANKSAGAAVVSSYNNIGNEIDELERIFGTLSDFEFEFSEPEIKKTEVRRNVHIRCTAEDWKQAVAMVEQLSKSRYQGMIREVNFFVSESENNILSGPVSLILDYTYFETTVDSESLEGLTIEKNEMEE